MENKLSLHIAPSVNRIIAKKINEYVCWLTSNYSFPLTVNIYIYGSKYVLSGSGEHVSANFWGPFDKQADSTIKVSAGDYTDLLKNNSFEDTILMIINSLSHEVQHYYQWVDDLDFDEEDAEYGATELTTEYIESLISD